MTREEAGDAFDVLGRQDRLVIQLLAGWREATRELESQDDVDVRSQRGSDVKLLLQHLAVRETAIDEIARRLRERGNAHLADLLEGDGPRRRKAIGHLDRLTRGQQAMATNNAAASLAVGDLAVILDREVAGREALLRDVGTALGPPEARDLPSARYVRTHSPTVPSPVPRWHDRVGPLKALRALYDHLRGSPSGGTRPSVDEAREHTPDLRDWRDL